MPRPIKPHTDLHHDGLIRRRTQTKEQLLRFRAAMDTSGDAIYLVDRAAMRFVDVNETACRRMGYSRAELLKMGPQDLLGSGREQLEREYDEVIAAGATGITTESSARAKDGRNSVAELHRRAMRSRDGWIIVSIARDITRRKGAELALEHEILRYKALMETAIEGIHIVDRNGYLVEANPAFLRMIGYEKDEAMTLKVEDWDAKWNWDDMRARIANRTAVGTIFETKHRRKDGSIYDVEISVSDVEIAGEHYFYCAARDITKRKEAERRIERLTRLYATLSQTNEAIMRARSEDELFAAMCRIAIEHGGMTGAVVRIADEEARILRAVAFSENMRPLVDATVVGTDPSQPGSQTPTAIAYREDRLCIDNDHASESSALPWLKVLQALEIRSVAALPLRRGGKPIGAFILNAPVPDFFDSELCVLLEEMATDISLALNNFEYERRRKHTEEGLAESEEKFRGLVEQSLAGIHIIEDGRFSYVNPRGAEIFGYTPEELIGQPITMVVAEEGRALVAENMRWRLAGEVRSMQYSFTGLRKDGSKVTIGAHGAVAKVEGRSVIIGMAQDIGEREQAQRQIEAYIQQLEEAMLGTVQAVSTIVELRDPYTAGHEKRVGALARAIGQELGLPEETCRGLEITGTVHDIGKVSIPAEILSKPGKLTAIEFSLIKTHPQLGHDVLKGVAFPWPLAQTILQHHERLDGSGYPNALKGDAIILEACVMAVADVVEAIASHRPYRPTLGIDAALEEIAKFRGVRFDEKVVDACLRLFREKAYVLPS